MILGSRGAIVGLVLLAIGLVLPFVHGVYIIFAQQILCYALAAVALDMLLGFTGLLSFGHALFWGGSGYVTAILISKGTTSMPLAVLLGVAYALVLSFVVGAIAVRRSGIFFAMITLAIAEIQYFAAFQLIDLTGGESGLTLPTRGTLFGLGLEDDRVYYYVALAVVALGTIAALRIVASPFGMVLGAMRENENRAKALGYDADRLKLTAFVMSGTLAGLAGSLYVLSNRFVSLDNVDWHTSGAFVMMTILGGIGTIYGPIVGAVLFQSLDYFVSKTPVGDKTNLVMGTVFIIVVLAARRGLVGEILHRLRPNVPLPPLEEPLAETR